MLSRTQRPPLPDPKSFPKKTSVGLSRSLIHVFPPKSQLNTPDPHKHHRILATTLSLENKQTREAFLRPTPTPTWQKHMHANA